MKQYRVWLADRHVTVRADDFDFAKNGYVFLRAGEPCGFFHRDSVHGFAEVDPDDGAEETALAVPEGE